MPPRRVAKRRRTGYGNVSLAQNNPSSRVAPYVRGQGGIRNYAPLRTGGFYGPKLNARELKVIDTAAATYQCDTGGTIALISGVTTGTDFTNRIGRKIIIKSIQLRGLVLPEDDETSNTIARVMLVHDLQTNAALPNITDVLDTNNANSFMNLSNRDRFRVLMDKIMPMGRVSTGVGVVFSNGKNTYIVNKYKKVRIEEIFSGTTNAIGSIASGSVYILTTGLSAAGSGAKFVAQARIRFEDP